MKSHKNICGIVIILTLFLISSGCQKKIHIVMSTGGDSYTQSLNELIVVDGDYQKTLDQCLERLRRLEDDESIEAADIYSIMGGIYAEYAYDEIQAIKYLNKAIEIHERSGDRIRLAVDYTQMSKIYISRDSGIEEGLKYIEKAEQIFKESNMEESIVMAGNLVNKGIIQMYSDQAEESLVSLNEAQEIYKKRQTVDINIVLHIGRAYMQMQEYELAEKQALEAIHLWELEDNKYRIAEANNFLANVYYHTAEYEKALEHCKQALEFYQTSEVYISDISLIYNNIASLYDYSNEIENAIEYGIKACRTLEVYQDEGPEDRKTRYKERLSKYYGKWSADKMEEGYEAWYEAVVINGEDWRTR